MHAQEDKKKLPTEEVENQENQNINEPEKQAKDIEQKEEAKLRMKYPGLKAGGGSFLAQKRLSRGQKYFDSGDYAMAKAKTGGLPGPGMKAPVVPGKGKFLPPGSTTGDVIPTPESLPPRKPSLIQSKLASGNLS